MRTKYGAKNNATKRKKQIRYRNKLKQRIKDTNDKLGLGYIEKEGTEKERVRTYSLGNSDLKKHLNRKLRRRKNTLYQNGEYKKAGEYWWNIL